MGRTPWPVLSELNTRRRLTPNSSNFSSSSLENIPAWEESSHQSQLYKTSTFKEILDVEAISYQKNISESLITLERNDISKINDYFINILKILIIPQ